MSVHESVSPKYLQTPSNLSSNLFGVIFHGQTTNMDPKGDIFDGIIHKLPYPPSSMQGEKIVLGHQGPHLMTYSIVAKLGKKNLHNPNFHHS